MVSLHLRSWGPSLTYGVARKLEDVRRGLAPLVEQENVIEFLADNKNAQRTNCLVEDIGDALMEYQVRTSNCTFFTMSDVRARPHCNKISTKRAVSSS